MRLKLKIQQDNRYLAMVSAFISGLLIHMMGFVTILHNADDIAAVPQSVGVGISSGRWMLEILGMIEYRLQRAYDLPWLNSLIGLALLSVAVFFVVSLFDIKRKRHAVLIGIINVSLPCFATMVIFSFTTIYYCLALLMSVIAAHIVVKSKGRCLPVTLASGLISACALGIYQAYFPVTAALFVLCMLQQLLGGKSSAKEVFLKGLHYLLCLVLGLVFYFVLLKLFLFISRSSLSAYRGLNEISKIQLSEFPFLILDAFTSFFGIPLKNQFNMAPGHLAQFTLLGLYAVTFLEICLNLIMKRAKPSVIILTLVLCVLFPICTNLVVAMALGTPVYSLMLHGYWVALIGPVVFLELIPKDIAAWEKFRKFSSAAAVLLLSVLIYCYTYSANVFYTSIYYANRQVENTVNSIATQIRMTEGFNSDMVWAFVGRLDDPLVKGDQWSAFPMEADYSNVRRLCTYPYVWSAWIRNYIGYTIQLPDADTLEALSENTYVKAMPCWPDYGSIQILGDTVVVKLSD